MMAEDMEAGTTDIALTDGQPEEAAKTAHEESEPPPKYSTVFKRVQAAKQQSTSKKDFIKSLPAIFIGSIGYTICLGIFLAIPISMVVMGALYLDDCPVERYIPIYLIVGGVFGLFQNISGLVQSVCQQKSSDHENSALSKFCKFSESIIGCFIIAWFIAGNVWIYSTLNKFTTNPEDETYCNPTLYWYAFWLTTAGYILLGVIILVCAVICCVMCCAACAAK